MANDDAIKVPAGERQTVDTAPGGALAHGNSKHPATAPGVPTPVPPPPPVPPGHQFQMVGIHVVPDNLAQLVPEAQREMVEFLDHQDQRQADVALAQIKADSDIESQDLEDRGRGRKQILVAIGAVSIALVVGCLLVIWWLVQAGKPELVQPIVQQAFTAIVGILGGVGVAQLARSIARSRRDQE